LGRRILLVAAIFGALLFGVTDAGAASTFTDPAGDTVGGAADITQIVVSNDFDGNITLAFTIPDRTTFTSDDLLLVLLNTDKDTSTGVSGVDYAIGVGSDGVLLLRASGGTFAPAPQTTLRTADNGKTITLNRSDLGDTSGFIFLGATSLQSNDNAADATSVFTYDLELKPVLETLAARYAPTKPKAGKIFRLAGTTLRLDDGTTVKADSVTCVAKLNGKRLAGRCSWRMPKKAKGKRLVVTLTAHYKGVSTTFTPWRFKVG
jgi:hypothetical protein